MKFSTAFSLVGAVFASVVCAKKVQLMVVYEHTTGAIQTTDFKKAFLGGLERSLASLTNSEVEIALATSTDKPAPSVGVGAYGGYPDTYGEDWCYRREVDFTTDLTSVEQSLLAVEGGAGLDVSQAQLEGVVTALYDAKWEADSDHIVMLVTQSWAHVADVTETNLASVVVPFNQPVRCLGETATIGGFGSTTPNVAGSAWTASEAETKLYANLHAKRACSTAGLTADEEQTYNEYRNAEYVVRKYPEVKAFDTELIQENHQEHCRYHEYPSYAQVRDAFTAKSAKWIVLHAEREGQSGWTNGDTWQYTVSESTWGFAPTPMVVGNLADRNSVTEDEFASIIKASFDALSVTM